MKKICRNCGKVFDTDRSHAKTCSASCRNAMSAKEKLKKEMRKSELIERENFRTEISGMIQKVESDNLHINQKIEALRKSNIDLAGCINISKKFIKNAQVEVAELRKKYRMNDYDYYNKFLNERYLKAIRKNDSLAYIHLVKENGFIGFREREKIKSKVTRSKKEIEKSISKLDSDIKIYERKLLKLKTQKSDIEPEINRQMVLINHNHRRILELQHKLVLEPERKDLTIEKSGKNQDLEKALAKGVITGTDLLSIEFETFTLTGELGRFLGNLERFRLAIALTGDSGAGKTNFSFELAHLFLANGFKVKYYSLEMGICAKLKELILKYNCQEISVQGTGKLNDVKKDTKVFDVIIIDSYGKLTNDPKLFDKLRQEFPNTIFVFIFQKTNNGTMRGGAGIKFDSAMTIDVRFSDDERVAFMEKSRFGTIGWEYSISDRKIIKEN